MAAPAASGYVEGREPIITIEKQWNALSELSITKVFMIRTSGLRAIQAVTTSPRACRSMAFVAEKTFTTLIRFALADATPLPDAASSILLCTFQQWSSERPARA